MQETPTRTFIKVKENVGVATSLVSKEFKEFVSLFTTNFLQPFIGRKFECVMSLCLFGMFAYSM